MRTIRFGSLLAAATLICTQGFGIFPTTDRVDTRTTRDGPPRLAFRIPFASGPVAFVSDGDYPTLVAGQDSNISWFPPAQKSSFCLWNLRPGAALTTLQPLPATWPIPTCIAVSHDKSRIAAYFADRHIRTWNASSYQLAQNFVVQPGKSIRSLAFSSDDKMLIGFDTKGKNGSVIDSWDAISGKALPSRLCALGERDVFQTAFAPTGRTVACVVDTPRKKKCVEIREIETGKLLREFDRPKGLTFLCAVANSPGGLVAGLGGGGGYRDPIIVVWEAATGQLLSIIPREGWNGPHTIAFRGATNWIASPRNSSSGNHEVRIWNARNGQLLYRLSQPGWVQQITSSRNGRWLAISTCDKENRPLVTIWEIPRLPG